MATDNKQLARRLIEEVWNKGQLELIDELLDPAYEGHDPLLGTLKRDALRNSVKGYRSAFPDLRFEVNAVLGEGNFVTTRWTARGTHLGPLLGRESTGRSAQVTGISVAEIRNGRIISDYAEWDALGLFRQLGLQDVTVPLAVRKPAPQEQRRP
jgi:steroid delta-isomerase-like uncharacterized protein